MRKLVYLAVLAATLLPALAASAETPAEKNIAQRIGSHLKQSGQLQNYRVGVKFHDGTAILAGSVASPEQRDIAMHLAQEVPGVKHVVCKLDCPNAPEHSSNNLAADTSESQQIGGQLNQTSFDEAQNDPSSGVMPAFEPASNLPEAPIQQNMISQNPMQQNAMAQQQIARIPAPQARRSNMPVPYQRMPGMMPPRQAGPAGVQQASCNCNGGGMGPGAMMGAGMGPGCQGGGGDGAPAGFVPNGSGRGPAYDNPQMPGYAWPSYASYPNYAALSYPQQYSPTAWPYIGPFYPYPQVPLAWRKVSLEWDDGWWFLDFSSHNSNH